MIIFFSFHKKMLRTLQRRMSRGDQHGSCGPATANLIAILRGPRPRARANSPSRAAVSPLSISISDRLAPTSQECDIPVTHLNYTFPWVPRERERTAVPRIVPAARGPALPSRPPSEEATRGFGISVRRQSRLFGKTPTNQALELFRILVNYALEIIRFLFPRGRDQTRAPVSGFVRVKPHYNGTVRDVFGFKKKHRER